MKEDVFFETNASLLHYLFNTARFWIPYLQTIFDHLQLIVMRYIIFISLLTLPFFSVAQKLEGPFKATAAQYGDINADPLDMMKEQIVKVFKNGYWIATTFGNSLHPFKGCTGGTYEVKDGKYIEKVDFSSWDSTAVGKVFIFDCKVLPNQFAQKGYVNSVKYPNHLVNESYRKIPPVYPLKNHSLEGVWFLQSTVWDGDNPFPNPVTEIKIYTYPRFTWAQYDAATKRFIGAGGGTYRFDGKKLVETIEYFTYEMALGTEFNVDVQLAPNGTMLQTSWGGRMIETWKKADR